MKYQVLFSLKYNENIFKTVVCCSHDWHFKGLKVIHGSELELTVSMVSVSELE